jgi:hypothetical protein
MLFDEAVSYLANIIRLAPSNQSQATPNNPARRVAASNTYPGRSAGRSGRSTSANTQAGRSHASNNSDRSNFVPHEAWGLLTPAQRFAIANNRRETESSIIQQHGGYGRGGRGFVHRGGGRGRFDHNRGGRTYHPGRNINSVNIERQIDSSDMSQMTETAAPPPHNNAGRSFGRSSYITPHNRGTSTVSNNTPRTNDDSTNNRYNRNISTIVSSPRRIAKTTRHQSNDQNNVIYGKLEMDNHADTHALGNNCTVLSWTGRTCNVSPFSNYYHPITNVEIVTAATAYDDPMTGETTVLIFHEALWLGDHMTDSLINPNQCRAFGISICDDPFDPHRSLGISDSAADIIIPFKMYGTTAAVVTRSISLSELAHTRHLVMCNSTPWDPNHVMLPSSASDHTENNPKENYVIAKVIVPPDRQI